MKKQEEVKLNMMNVVLDLLNESAVIVATMAALLTSKAGLKLIIKAIEDGVGFTELNVTGITQTKAVKKSLLVDLAYSIAAGTYAFADATGNEDLKGKLNFSKTKFNQQKDGVLAAFCQNIYDLANTNILLLADYNILPANLVTLQAYIDAYKTASPKNRTAVSERKTTNTNITKNVKKGMSFLKNSTDKLVASLALTQPVFGLNYQNARIIVGPGVTVTNLQGIVTDADGNLLEGVKVTMGTIFTITDVNGFYQFKPAAIGLYDVQFLIAGFEVLTINGFKVFLGKNNHLDITLVKKV